MTNVNHASSRVTPLLELRLFYYDFLRRTFLMEPTKDFLVFVKNSMITPDFPLASESEMILEGVQQIKNYLSKNDVQSETVYNDLHWEYTRLFIGPYQLPSPPWESTYLNEERLLFQKETLAVRKAYLKYSFLPVEFGHEADDHLGLELDFMFRLSELGLEDIDQNSANLKQLLMDQKSFLEEHLLQWVPKFSKDMIQHAETDFYRGMGKILQGFLTLDLEALLELLKINS
jgi:Uncharacterized component of anaerobic dehydrogenases